MQKLAKRLSLLAATCFALIGTARAQMVTYTTLNDWTGSQFSLLSGKYYGETFYNVLAVYSMTYRFTASTTQTIGSTTLAATFAEWGGTPASSTTMLNYGNITIPSSSTWSTVAAADGNNYRYYDYTFLVNQTELDATATYALLFKPTSTTGLKLSVTDSDAFAYGSAIRGGLVDESTDWGFYQITITPVPEASTVAAGFAALFVVGMVGFRMHQRRRVSSSVAPVAA